MSSATYLIIGILTGWPPAAAGMWLTWFLANRKVTALTRGQTKDITRNIAAMTKGQTQDIADLTSQQTQVLLSGGPDAPAAGV